MKSAFRMVLGFLFVVFHKFFGYPKEFGQYAPDCHGACKAGEICLSDIAWPYCQAIPDAATISFQLPFPIGHEVICTHARGVGSHAWANAYFALDLATHPSKAAGVITAAAPGEVIYPPDTVKHCALPPGDATLAKTDQCHGGWGNRVDILHEGRIVSMYAHLQEIYVTKGHRVEKGDPIGLEGWTGGAGHRHLHWSVYRADHEPRIDHAFFPLDGQTSIPFRFQAEQNGLPVEIDTVSVECRHQGFVRPAETGQPRWIRR